MLVFTWHYAFNPSELSKNNIVVKFTFAFMTDKNTNLSSDSTNRSVKCQICDGTKVTYLMKPCYFCNETGLSNNFTNSFIKNHICLCSTTNRRTCPICKKNCHHDSTLHPKVLSVNM
jgi:hypothetical protein